MIDKTKTEQKIADALLVKEYYRIRPKIVKRIDAEWNPFAVYQELWEDYILPSCEEIRRGEREQAKNRYIRMVKKFCRIYHVEPERSLAEKYQIRTV